MVARFEKVGLTGRVANIILIVFEKLAPSYFAQARQMQTAEADVVAKERASATANENCLALREKS